MTSGSFDAVQKVPLGTLTPGSTGLPGAGLDPRCGVGDAIAIAAMRERTVMKSVERMMVEGGWVGGRFGGRGQWWCDVTSGVVWFV